MNPGFQLAAIHCQDGHVSMHISVWNNFQNCAQIQLYALLMSEYHLIINEVGVTFKHFEIHIINIFVLYILYFYDTSYPIFNLTKFLIHGLSVSLSLSLSHTHTHTQCICVCMYALYHAQLGNPIQMNCPSSNPN